MFLGQAMSQNNEIRCDNQGMWMSARTTGIVALISSAIKLALHTLFNSIQIKFIFKLRQNVIQKDRTYKH